MLSAVALNDGMKEALIKDITSERAVYPNVNGKKIVAFVDSRPGSGDAPFVVVTPKYGETKKNSLPLAYMLAANGFRVIRFDFTCHFGESDGDMLQFTLGEAVNNVRSTFDYLERTYGCERVTLLANSLSSLVAIRAASEDRRVAHLVCMVGVVNLTDTLTKVYQEDLVGGFIAGQRYGVLDILGHEVEMDDFFSAAIENRFHRLEDVVRDVSQIEAPISWFAAENDTWVSPADVEAVAGANKQMNVYRIEGAMHEVRENQEAADRSMRMLVSVCRSRYFFESPDDEVICHPERRLLMTQNRLERQQLRRARPVNESENEFWGQYLGKYRVMEKMDDYQQYLNLVGDLLGIIRPDQLLLDAGCGNGLFGVWVIRELIRRRADLAEQPPVYFGIDLTREGLVDAVDKHVFVRGCAPAGVEQAVAPVKLIYAQADLNKFGDAGEPEGQILQFADDCFDKIVCSLLLSYLENPGQLLQHLYRVLRPGGRMVISSMKPFCDLSAIYRDFVEQDAAAEDVESARELLRVAGAIKVKEEQGYYIFFSTEQLTALMKEAGFHRVQCFSSLGNQANVAVGQK